MALTKYGQGLMLSGFYGNAAVPTSFNIILFTTLPDVSVGNFGSGGVEVSGIDYAPVVVANNSTNFPPISNDNELPNGTLVDFGTAGGSWGTIVGYGVEDNANGNLIDATPLTENQTVTTGNQVRFPIGSLLFRLFNQA